MTFTYGYHGSKFIIDWQAHEHAGTRKTRTEKNGVSRTEFSTASSQHHTSNKHGVDTTISGISFDSIGRHGHLSVPIELRHQQQPTLRANVKGCASHDTFPSPHKEKEPAVFCSTEQSLAPLSPTVESFTPLMTWLRMTSIVDQWILNQ